jgi:hypothetical protein
MKLENWKERIPGLGGGGIAELGPNLKDNSKNRMCNPEARKVNGKLVR